MRGGRRRRKRSAIKLKSKPLGKKDVDEESCPTAVCCSPPSKKRKKRMVGLGKWTRNFRSKFNRPNWIYVECKRRCNSIDYLMDLSVNRLATGILWSLTLARGPVKSRYKGSYLSIEASARHLDVSLGGTHVVSARFYNGVLCDLSLGEVWSTEEFFVIDRQGRPRGLNGPFFTDRETLWEFMDLHQSIYPAAKALKECLDKERDRYIDALKDWMPSVCADLVWGYAKCVVHVALETILSVADAVFIDGAHCRLIKCPTGGHYLKKYSGLPIKNDGSKYVSVVCDGCEREFLHKHGHFWHCGKCEYDLCMACLLRVAGEDGTGGSTILGAGIRALTHLHKIKTPLLTTLVDQQVCYCRPPESCMLDYETFARVFGEPLRSFSTIVAPQIKLNTRQSSN